MSPAPPRILEIGELPLMGEAFPDTTEHWSTSQASVQSRGPYERIVTAATLPRLARRIADPSFDLIVVQPTRHAPFSIQWLNRGLLTRGMWRGHVPYARGFGQELLRGRMGAPLAVWDWDDQPFIFRHNLFLLDRAALYFKRELPPDHWRVFMGSRFLRAPPTRVRLVERERTRVGKLRPISLGLLPGRPEQMTARPVSAVDKTADVFFAGVVPGSSTVRDHGLDEIRALQANGVRVDIPEGRLPLAEFLERCGRAWLVWSPEGHGYDCFRTYEAAVCGSVPVVNRPTVHSYHPLRDGEHCFHYSVEPGGLTHAIETALRDRDRLMAMAAAAGAFVLAHHTAEALARYVAQTTLEAAGKARGV